jgi:hypothetical protein
MLFRKFAFVKIGSPLAIFMDQFAVIRQGTTEVVQLVRTRETKEENTGDRAHKPVGMGRASGHIDDRCFDSFFDVQFLQSLASRGIGSGGRDSPKGRTGSHGHHGESIPAEFHDPIDHGNRLVLSFPDGPEDSILGHRNSPVHKQEIASFLPGGRLLGRLHGQIPCPGHHRGIEAQADMLAGDHFVDQDIFNCRADGVQDGDQATRTGRTLQPDDRIFFGLRIQCLLLSLATKCICTARRLWVNGDILPFLMYPFFPPFPMRYIIFAESGRARKNPINP